MAMRALSYLAKVFPPPRFLTLPSVGIDISDSSLKYLQLRMQGRYLAPLRWGTLPLPPGAGTHGNITNMAALVAVLKKMRAACKTPYARVALPEERAYLFETTLAHDAQSADVRSVLEARLEENVPLPPQDALFDYDAIATETGMRLAVAVYARETVYSYADAFSGAGILPLSFEVEVSATARAVVPRERDGVSMVLDIGGANTGLGIVEGGVLRYASTVDIGGSNFTEALRRQFGGRGSAALVALKNEQGLLASAEKDEVYQTLLPPVAALRDEITKRLHYWNTYGGESPPRTIEKILLCGGSATLAGLPEYLGETLGIDTERADVWSNVPLAHGDIPPIPRGRSYAYATAIGLALRDTMEYARV